MADLKSETMDYAKLSAYAFVPALVIAMLLGIVSSALATASWLTYFILGIAIIYAGMKVPKEIESVWGIIILVMFLLGLQGFLGMLFPSVSILQWATIGSVNGLLVTMASAALGVALIKKYVK